MTDDIERFGDVCRNKTSSERRFFSVETIGDGGDGWKEGGDCGVEFGEAVL